MRSANIKYIPELDHLRCYAVVLICFYHGLHLVSYQQTHHVAFTFDNWLSTKNPFLAFIAEGHTAVALFMVLSGFIFTYGAFEKQLIYWKFISNRFLRTYPLFIFLVFIGIYSFPDQFRLSSFAQTVLGFSNTSGSLNLKSFSAMFWPIAVEWQFYLVFPFLLRFVQQYGWRYIVGTIVVFILFRTLAYFEGANIRDLSYWSIAGRMDQFLLGMLAGVAFHRVPVSRSAARFWLALLLAVVIVSLYIFHRLGGWPENGFYKLLWPTYEGLLWGAVIYCYIGASLPWPEWISRLLTSVGTISYSIYLTHFTVTTIMVDKGMYLAIFDNLHLNAMLSTLLIVSPITLLLSTLTYTFIEKPFLEMRVKYVLEKS